MLMIERVARQQGASQYGRTVINVIDSLAWGSSQARRETGKG